MNIMIFFDGTSNHPRDAKHEREWFGQVSDGSTSSHVGRREHL
jgi:hypothetical protein